MSGPSTVSRRLIHSGLVRLCLCHLLQGSSHMLGQSPGWPPGESSQQPFFGPLASRFWCQKRIDVGTSSNHIQPLQGSFSQAKTFHPLGKYHVAGQCHTSKIMLVGSFTAQCLAILGRNAHKIGVIHPLKKKTLLCSHYFHFYHYVSNHVSPFVELSP